MGTRREAAAARSGTPRTSNRQAVTIRRPGVMEQRAAIDARIAEVKARNPKPGQC